MASKVNDKKNENTKTSVNEQIRKVATKLKKNYDSQELFDQALGDRLPNKDIIISIMEDLRIVTFPGFFGTQNLAYSSKDIYAGNTLSQIYEKLFRQVRKALVSEIDSSSSKGKKITFEEISQKAEDLTLEFIHQIPDVQKLIMKDVDAEFAGDPAAKSKAEIILSYPGLYAIFVYRYAHVLYKMNIPFIPRIMTEHAHSQTGIDINPGATIGEYFFIDHGTGIVIGETTTIGKNVKIYQGVTLGALSTRKGQLLSGVKRHPTIEDNVVIYANTTILGGETVIGRNSVVAGNTFVTASIPPNTKVASMTPKLEMKNN